MINVLQVYRTYFPDTQGGAQEAVRQICLSTRSVANHRIFAPSDEGKPNVIKRDEGEVHQVKLDFEIASCGFTFSGITRFRQLVAWADVVHYHFPWPFADVLHELSPASRPTVVTYHSDIVRQKLFEKFYSPLRSRFLSDVDRIVATSPDYFRSSPVLSQHPDKVRVIPLGLDETSYPTVNDELLTKTKADYGEGFLFFVGVLRYYKGLEVLLKAARGQNVRVVVAGDGPMSGALLEMKRQWNLDNVVLAGRITDETKMALMQLCCGVVFPSTFRSEAFGVTLLEGAMSSKPMITTEIGSGTSYVNDHGVTGLVVPAEDPDALRDAMLAFVQDPERTSDMGLAARDRFERLFTGQVIGDQYASLYQELVSGSSGVVERSG